MMKLINYLSKNKYLQITLIIFVLYSALYIFSPFNQRIGDFIIDYEIINGVNNYNVFKSLLHTNSFCGSFLNNLITLLNYKLFNYSDTFIKIINYLLNISILFLTYYLFMQNYSNKKRYGAYFIFLLLAVDFFGVFQTASMNHIKIMIVINLLSFVLFNKSLSVNDNNKKHVFLIFSVALQLFAFNLSSILIYYYFLYKNNENKQIYISTIITYIICLLFNYQIFVNISNYAITTRLIYTLVSPIAPIIRIQASEYTQYVFIFCSIIMTLYLLLSFYSSIKRNNKDKLFINILLLINILITFIFYTNESYGYTAIHLVNRYIFAYTFYNLIINIKLIKHNNISKIYFSIEKLATSLSLLFIIITSMFGIVFIGTNRTLYTNGLSELAYTNRYDSGRLVNSDMNYVFEGSKNDILNKYQYFVENNILIEKYNKLEVNKDYNSKDNVRYIRGTKVDGLGERWLNSNFAFEIHVSDVTLSLKIYSPLENNLTLYVNNVEVGTRKVNYGENVLSFSIWDFYDENVIVNGIFENDYKGPLNNEGYWSCELMDISFISDYGYYELDDSGSGWTSTYFGNYYDKITKSLIYKFYLPDSMKSNEIEVYVNRNYINTYKVEIGMNDIYIDLNNHINSKVFIEFKLKEAIVSKNDPRLLGVILSKVEEYDAINNIEHIIYIDKPYLSIEFNNDVFPNNEVSLYIDNEIVSSNFLESEKNCTIKVSKYFGKSIILKESYKIGIDRSYIKNIELTNNYGIYDSNIYNSIWTSNKFGFYVYNINSNKVMNLYEIESLDNNYYEIFINGEKTQSGYLKYGMNDVNIDLSNYIGKSVYIDIVLEKYQDASIDGRILGCIISNFREVD